MILTPQRSYESSQPVPAHQGRSLTLIDPYLSFPKPGGPTSQFARGGRKGIYFCPYRYAAPPPYQWCLPPPLECPPLAFIFGAFGSLNFGSLIFGSLYFGSL
jgi:hypothetical protein